MAPSSSASQSGTRQRGGQQREGGGAEDEGMAPMAMTVAEERTRDAAAFGLDELWKGSFGHVVDDDDLDVDAFGVAVVSRESRRSAEETMD